MTRMCLTKKIERERESPSTHGDKGERISSNINGTIEHTRTYTHIILLKIARPIRPRHRSN